MTNTIATITPFALLAFFAGIILTGCTNPSEPAVEPSEPCVDREHTIPSQVCPVNGIDIEKCCLKEVF